MTMAESADAVVIDAPAKLTTGLRVTGVRDDGYHLIDAEMIALDEAFTRPQSIPTLKAVLLNAEGPHFSFGASVEEHLPD